MSEYQVGDPDPTVPDSNFLYCPAESNGYSCTRSTEHDGPHIAGDGIQICAVWSDDQP